MVDDEALVSQTTCAGKHITMRESHLCSVAASLPTVPHRPRSRNLHPLRHLVWLSTPKRPKPPDRRTALPVLGRFSVASLPDAYGVVFLPLPNPIISTSSHRMNIASLPRSLPLLCLPLQLPRQSATHLEQYFHQKKNGKDIGKDRRMHHRPTQYE